MLTSPPPSVSELGLRNPPRFFQGKDAHPRANRARASPPFVRDSGRGVFPPFIRGGRGGLVSAPVSNSVCVIDAHITIPPTRSNSSSFSKNAHPRTNPPPRRPRSKGPPRDFKRGLGGLLSWACSFLNRPHPDSPRVRQRFSKKQTHLLAALPRRGPTRKALVPRGPRIRSPNRFRLSPPIPNPSPQAQFPILHFTPANPFRQPPNPPSVPDVANWKARGIENRCSRSPETNARLLSFHPADWLELCRRGQWARIEVAHLGAGNRAMWNLRRPSAATATSSIWDACRTANTVTVALFVNS